MERALLESEGVGLGEERRVGEEVLIDLVGCGDGGGAALGEGDLDVDIGEMCWFGSPGVAGGEDWGADRGEGVAGGVFVCSVEGGFEGFWA